MLELNNFSVDFLRHASTLVSFGEKKIYIDPWQLPPKPPTADLVLVTHEHYDHFDPEKIAQISGPQTVVVANERCAKKMPKKPRVISAGKTMRFGKISVQGVDAYNIGKKFHPKGLVVGYVIGFGGEKLYHAGDTDFIPEIKQLKGISVALVPIGGTYTMSEREAAAAVNSFLPKIAVPMHYNVVEGTEADPKKFAAEVSKEIKVEILY